MSTINSKEELYQLWAIEKHFDTVLSAPIEERGLKCKAVVGKFSLARQAGWAFAFICDDIDLSKRHTFTNDFCVELVRLWQNRINDLIWDDHLSRASPDRGLAIQPSFDRALCQSNTSST